MLLGSRDIIQRHGGSSMDFLDGISHGNHRCLQDERMRGGQQSTMRCNTTIYIYIYYYMILSMIIYAIYANICYICYIYIYSTCSTNNMWLPRGYFIPPSIQCVRSTPKRSWGTGCHSQALHQDDHFRHVTQQPHQPHHAEESEQKCRTFGTRERKTPPKFFGKRLQKNWLEKGWTPAIVGQSLICLGQFGGTFLHLDNACVISKTSFVQAAWRSASGAGMPGWRLKVSSIPRPIG